MRIVNLLLAPLLVNLVNAKTTAAGRKAVNIVLENAWFAALSYCPDKSLIDWACKSCKMVPNSKFITSFNNASYGTRGVLVRNDKKMQLVISFRGSQNNLNDENNMNIVLSPLNKRIPAMGNVHTGFLESMKSLLPKFIPALVNARKKYNNYDVVITGHSLGGAIASIAIEDIRSQLKIPDHQIQLITYGQPLTGDATFANWHNKQKYITFRAVNEKDAIPHVPILGAFSYKHHNRELWAHDSNILRICKNKTYDDPHCSVSVPRDQLSDEDHLHFFKTTFGPGAC